MKKKGLFYNTAPLGIGHLSRGLSLCSKLSDAFKIELMLGSLPRLPIPPSIQLIQLPPLIRPFEKGPLIDPYGKKPLEAILNERRAVIQNLKTTYEFLIIEHFPFGRHCLMEEIQTLIEKVKRLNHKCLIISSFRGEKEIHQKSLFWIKELIANHFDKILVHIDPEMISPETLLNSFPESKSKFAFTGFVTDPHFILEKKPRLKQILVSSGSGAFGEELFTTVAKVAPYFSDYQFIFVTDKNYSGKNIQVLSFLSNFREKLAESALSISLGGAGTVSDLLLTQTKAVLFPHPLPKDQLPRVKALSQKGLAIIVSTITDPSEMRKAIEEGLTSPIAHYKVKLDGAEESLKIIQQLMGNKK